MNADGIDILSVFLFSCHPIVDIQNVEIFTAEVERIAVEKAVILPLSGVRTYAVAGDNAELRAIVRDKVMTSPPHDLVGGIKEEIIHVKFQHLRWREIIIKHFPTDIDRRAEIDVVVTIIDQTDPFFKGQRVCRSVMLRDKGVISKKAAPLEICRMGRLRGWIAAETDMLSPVCQRGAEVGFSILAAGRKNAIR